MKMKQRHDSQRPPWLGFEALSREVSKPKKQTNKQTKEA